MMEGSCHCGKAGWTLTGEPGQVTACNCTLCRRYGALWAYDVEGERMAIIGETSAYQRSDKDTPFLEIRFCPECAAVICWRALKEDEEGRRRMAVNIRLAPPEQVAALTVRRFDGLESFSALPRDNRCVREIWS